MHESYLTPRACFITATYDDDELPADGGLQKEDWTRFKFRVTKKHGPWRYFSCGEYGGDTKRPHYHANVFGLDWVEDRRLVSKKDEPGQETYHSETLSRLWGKGEITIQPLTQEKAFYTAGYTTKKLRGNDERRKEIEWERYGRTDGEERWMVEPEFGSMSSNLGIEFLELYWMDVYSIDKIVMNGKTFGVPKAYDRWLEQAEPAEWDRVRKRRVSYMTKNPTDMSRTRLSARKKIQEQKQKGKKRNGV